MLFSLTSARLYKSEPGIDHSGFTLLEVLVAVAVLSIVLLSAVKNGSNIVSNASFLEEHTLGHWVAMNKAADLRLERDWPAVGTSVGTAQLANREWQWQIVMTNSSYDDMRQAIITVGRAGDETASSCAELTLFVKRP